MTQGTQRGRWVRICRYYVLGLLSLWLLRSLLFTDVSAGTVGVRYSNALGLDERDLGPGLHLEVIGLHRVWRLPSHYLEIAYNDATALSIRTRDNNTVEADVSIPYRIKRGEAWQVMDAGNHLMDGNGKYRFQRFAEETSTSVLREQLAQLRSEDFYNTDRRLEVADTALQVLNKKLASYHLEALAVLVRATYFREAYENQLASIQFNEQQKLLDGAKRSVAEQRQALDNYQQETTARAAAAEQAWAGRIADLDRAYQVGLIDGGDDQRPGAARKVLLSLTAEQREQLIERAVEIFGIEPDRITDAHLLGLKNVEAETAEYGQRVLAEGDAVSARLSAEGDAQVAKIEGAYQARVNQLLGSPAGRAYVAHQVAENINFADQLTFQSKDGIPSVLRLSDFARAIMGR